MTTQRALGKLSLVRLSDEWVVSNGSQVLDLAKAPKWHSRAACAEVDPELFFVDRGQSSKAAKLVCAGCPVRAKCRDYALEHREEFGIWGGLSSRDRRALRAQPKREARIPYVRPHSP